MLNQLTYEVNEVTAQDLYTKAGRKRTTLDGQLRAMYRPGVVYTHLKIKKQYGKAVYCENDPSHRGKRYEWANLSGEYKLERSDWKQLCPSCHRKMDYTESQRELIRKRNLGKPALNRRKVAQLTTSGDLIKVHDHIYQASADTSTSRTGILNVLAGRANTSGGYRWCYAEGVS